MIAESIRFLRSIGRPHHKAGHGQFRGMDGVSGNNGTAVQISIPSIFWFLACSEAIFVTFFLTLLMELDYFRVHKSFTAVADDRTIGSAAANSSM